MTALLALGRAPVRGRGGFDSRNGRGRVGLPREIVRREGAQIFGCDVDPVPPRRQTIVRAAGGRSRRVRVLTSPRIGTSWVAAAVAEYGGIDILYNNAGAVRFGTIADCSPDDWAFTLRNELDLVMWTTQAVWPHLIARGGGAIVNTGSTSALRGHTRLGQSAHTAAKAAVIALTIQHAGEGSPHSIRVNSMSPGPTDTPALRAVIGDAELPSPIPLGRIGNPEDIARCALFLASDEASWITAANVVVDGGMSMIDGAEPVMVTASGGEGNRRRRRCALRREAQNRRHDSLGSADRRRRRSRLSEQPEHHVILIEAGSDYPDQRGCQRHCVTPMRSIYSGMTGDSRPTPSTPLPNARRSHTRAAES